jgi:hypothetical protein
MRNPTNSSRSSLTIALSLGFLAMALCEPALAAGQRDASRGGKQSVVRNDPSPAPAPPLGTKVRVIEKAPHAIVGASAALMRILFTLRF